jgi:GH24 family phage-related lysozyme (muramidase)
MNPRIVVAALSVSAALVIGHLWPEEGWTETAVVPVRGDVPTLGPGLTKREDGTPVRMGDTVKPLDGARRSLAHIQRDEGRIKQCVTAPLHQREYDLMVDFSYQYGAATLCRSSIVSRANAGDYAGSCEAYKEFRLVRAAPGERFGPGMVVGKDGVMRYDCSTLIDGKPNKRCYGVWTRQLKRHKACMEAQ